MDNNTTVVDGYTLGALGLNVATSLIFEEWADKPALVKPYLGKISQFRINLHTLVRNVSEALEDEVRTVEAIVDYVIGEIPTLLDAISEYFPKIEYVFYVTELKYYSRVIPRSEIRVSRSERIRKIAKLEATAVGDLADQLEENGIKIERISEKQGHIAKTAMVLTHLPSDLLCYRYYSDLYLVESHTGNIRKRTTFSNKILPSHRRPDAHLIPFNHMSFQVYGDGGKMLHQASGAITTAYTELAREKKWNYMTSAEKIVTDINRSGNKKLIDWFAR